MSAVTVSGQIKFYDAEKGYGFITVEDMPDVLLHASVLKRNTWIIKMPVIGTRIKVQAFKSGKGWRATKVLEMD